MNVYRLGFKILLLLVLSIYISSEPLFAKNNSTEIRAVWLTTNWYLDWPSSAKQSVEQQQDELKEMLDHLQRANFNTVLFQARVRGDVFYKSRIEPLSVFSETQSSLQMAYDPLQFVIEECHKRGLQCHAWFVTFPVGTQKHVDSQGGKSIVKKRPEICKFHQGEWYLDPGNPSAREYILNLVDELVQNYDIDGIHFDYLRYPENLKKFPDTDTYRKYGHRRNRMEWRRDNINELVKSIYNGVKRVKPWVQVSCSPLGRYKSKNRNGTTWSAYESVCQDAGKWMQEGVMDAIYPMMYYNESDFNYYVYDWLKYSNRRFVVPGLGAYRLDENEGNWAIYEITNQIDEVRNSDIAGFAFYRAKNVLNDTKGLKTSLAKYYKYPAKMPPMKWLKNSIPEKPQNMEVYRDKNGFIAIKWEAGNDLEQYMFTVYESDSRDIDITDAKNIIMTGIRSNKIYLDTDDVEEGVYYTVTASDRFNNESSPCNSAYFILSRKLSK